jgi:phosphoserine phosphatase
MPSRSAAFFRLEGVLAPTTGLACAAWLATNRRELWSRLRALAPAVARVDLPFVGPEAAYRLAWRTLSGCSEDRFIVLCEDWYRERLDGKWKDTGLALLESCREQGQRIVLLSDHPEAVVAPARDALGADDRLCNHVEIVDGEVTGELLDPVFTGHRDGTWLRRYCSQHGLDPVTSCAYGAAKQDATLLSGVGRPCAVTPERGLRQLAQVHDWPIVEAR